MGGHHVGSALVIEDGRATGIFTEQDVLRALASDFDAAHHPVADWMTHDPTTVGIEADVRTARDLMLDSGFRHLPVLDGAELVGIVSIRGHLARRVTSPRSRCALARELLHGRLERDPHVLEHLAGVGRRLAVLAPHRSSNGGCGDLYGLLEHCPVELSRHRGSDLRCRFRTGYPSRRYSYARSPVSASPRISVWISLVPS